MKKYLHSPIFRFALLGFIASLGAPIGFYIHDFIFNHVEGKSFWEQVIWIHQNKFSTIFYIGSGTNLFFTVFGAIVGKYSIELARAHSANTHLKETKNDLIKHSLSHMRISTSIGLESLLHLKEGDFSSVEYDNLLLSSIQQLYKVDESIRNLIELQSHTINDEHKISELEIIDLIKKSSAKNEMLISGDSLFATLENNQINVNALLFSMAMDQLFEWTKNNEMELNQVQLSYFMYPHNDSTHEHEQIRTLFSTFPLIICLEFKVSGNEVQKFEAPFLVEFIEKCQGTCFYYKGSILILLPAEEQEVKARAA